MNAFVAFLRQDASRALSMLCLVTAVLFSQSWIVAVLITVVAAALAADAIQVHRATRTLRAIAEGDRFVAFPKTLIESRHCLDIAAAGERMRQDLLDADAAIADQRRLLAEARIRREGAQFFTARFHQSVAEKFSGFARRGDQICATVDSLATHNAGLLRDAQSVSETVTGSAQDIKAVSQAAAQIADIVASTSDQIAASEAATRLTLSDLQRARDTIERLKRASDEISAIIGIIHSVASQTSLLALNATIEAARAGEKGLGFAVVAGEVKTLAMRSEQATGTIRRQIEEIQNAVSETSGAINTVMARVTSLTSAHDAFATSLMQNTMAIENVGATADSVAGRVSRAMPDLAAGVGEIEMAGRSVLENARQLMASSEHLVATFQTYFDDLASGSIKVGILHSLSGTVTAVERPLHDLLIGLIDSTNRSGGLLGRPLEAVIVNPRSSAKAYADGVRQLLDHEAAAIFGCWTSQSRVETIPVLEANDGLLFYPSQYEGGESSRAVVYTGGTPQQQAWPAVDFLVSKGRDRLILVGHDTVYSNGTHRLIKSYAPTVGAIVEMDVKIPQDVNWSRIVETVAKASGQRRLAIISTLSGDASVSFFRELSRQKISADRLPVLCLSIGEAEMPSLDARRMGGNFVAWNYLQGIRHAANDAFVATWRRICNQPDAATYDALEATYVGFTLWTMAVRKAGSTRTADVRAALQGLSLVAPTGFRLDITADQHTVLPAFVGQIQSNGSILPVWASRHAREANGRQQATAPAAA